MNEPKEAPEELALRARPRPVTRLSRRAFALLLGAVALVVMLSLTWALRDRSRGAAPAKELHNVERVQRAEGLEQLPRDYASLPKAPQLGGPLPGEFGRPMLKAERDAGVEPLPARSNFRPDPEEDAARAERLRLRREGEEAAKAEVFFRLRQAAAAAREPASSPAAPVPEPPSAGLSAGSSADDNSTQNLQESRRRFANAATDQRIYGSGKLQSPASPYQLMAGTVIAAALVTGIKSDLPGQVIASVTEHVYDSISGRHVLVPQGARLLGQYDSQVAYGQRRVLLVWNRIVLPDGSSLVIDRLPGVDVAGYAGLEDDVDWHWRRILVGAALSTLLGVGSELAAPERGGDAGRIIVATRESAQEAINEVGQQITQRNLDVQPTLTVRPGFPVRVIVSRDLTLRPYQITTTSGKQ